MHMTASLPSLYSRLISYRFYILLFKIQRSKERLRTYMVNDSNE
jgi:hypothetical protein